MESLHYENLETLAAAVNAWCAKRDVSPASGQAADTLSERNIRYYRTLGLLEGPREGGGYEHRHFLQLAAIRVLQSHGMPLRRIQELLYGRDDNSLEELLERASHEIPAAPEFPPFSTETWHVSALGGPYALLCRGGSRPTPSQLSAIAKILSNQLPIKK